MTSCRHGYADADADLCALAQANGNCHEKATCGSKVEKAKLKAVAPSAPKPVAPKPPRNGKRGRTPRVRCPNGHLYSQYAMYRHNGTERYCGECNRLKSRRWWGAHHQAGGRGA